LRLASVIYFMTTCIHGGDLQPDELHDAEIDDPFA